MKPNLFDIHTHLNFSEFDRDREEVIKRSLKEGIWLINVGSCFENSQKAVKIAEKYPEGVYASVGLHPLDQKKEEFYSARYRALAVNPKVVAIGECGLELKPETWSERKSLGSDYLDFEKQKDIFQQHIELALDVNKPLMIHCRGAHQEVLDILAPYYKFHGSALQGNVHFFSGTYQEAQKYFDLGFSISFTGVISFTRDYDEIIRRAPLNKIMLETDAPYVAPLPYRGQRNEPFYVKEVAQRIADIRGLSYEEIAKITTENALRLFNL